MKYAITQHPLFEADLTGIHRIIEDYADEQTADRKIGEIVSFIDRLTDFPMIGTVRTDIMPGLRAIPAAKKAVLCFVVDEAALQILILGISYAGADWQAMVAERRKGT